MASQVMRITLKAYDHKLIDQAAKQIIETKMCIRDRIMVDEFGTGAFSMCVVEGMSDKDISAMRKERCKVEGVKDVLWYDSFMDLSVPIDLLPDSIKDVFVNKMCIRDRTRLSTALKPSTCSIAFVIFTTSLLEVSLFKSTM